MEYVPVLLMLLIGAGLGGAILLVSSLLGPKFPNLRKDQPFECGVPGYGDTKQRISVRFYLIAILFLLFDVEAVFFFPFAIIYREFLAASGTAILWSMGFFVAVLLLGYYYVLRKGALEWD
jgi:NADH-quinone oxidoreductase subunit A